MPYINNFKVIDNFLSPNILGKLLDCSEKLSFHDLSSWTEIRGRRSKPLNRVKRPLYRKLKENLLEVDFLSEAKRVSLFLHKLCNDHFEEGYELSTKGWHRDLACNYAGVVYLNDKIEPNSGTLLNIEGEIISVENRYNRLVVYRSDILHRVENAFSSVDNPRLTLTLFAQ